MKAHVNTSNSRISGKSRLGEIDTVTISKSLSSIKELGRYRSFLRLKAMGIAPQYRSKLEASDLVQQTLMEAHQKIDQFRGQTEPEMAKWLSRMLAHNITDAVRALRRKKRDVARERSLEYQANSSMRGADWLPAEQSSPSLGAQRAEQMVELSEAISKLPVAQQEVIILHHLQGQSLAQVAAHMDRSPSAVAGLLYRGLKALRKTLK